MASRAQRRAAARRPGSGDHRPSPATASPDLAEINRQLNRWAISDERATELDEVLGEREWIFVIQSYQHEDDEGRLSNFTEQHIRAPSANEARDIAAYHLNGLPYHRVARMYEPDMPDPQRRA